jgi:superfamily I DNA/RNA helicase
MTGSDDIDHEVARSNDSQAIIESAHPRKVVLAGPGTGKSYLFKQAIEKKKQQGSGSFLAVTFIGKLSDGLADDLAGLSKTTTLHGFARRFVLDHCPDEWEYVPFVSDVILEDLAIRGHEDSQIGDANYEERTKHYKAVGHNDVVHYAVEICKADQTKIPEFDLILIDEFQDFNEKEAELVDILASKNDVLIVGDDDQALYEFKGSFSAFIRERHDEANDQFESHTLGYCSRCTEVIIRAFHSVIDHFQASGKLADRVPKEYKYYPPDKSLDSENNPKILLVEGVGPNAIPQQIKRKLSAFLKDQDCKTVLVLGEARTCQSQLRAIAKKLKEIGFNNVSHREVDKQHNVFALNERVIAGYKVLNKGSNDVLAWRLLIDELGDDEQKRKLIEQYFEDGDGFVGAIPSELRNRSTRNCRTLATIQTQPPSRRAKIAQSSLDELMAGITTSEKERNEVFMDQVIQEARYLSRPLANLDISVCSILQSKGLSADIVFLVGFDNGKFPLAAEVTNSEIYQFLVALTRARKRLYLFNTMNCEVSQFIECIDDDCIERLG